MSKEMLGGCCVCSDERGWTENPLVYCDGQGCTVAVHQACYGIVTVPTGPWFCRKCESQERAARVRCELCPSKDGALKRTDNTGWAHVVCALYIPEVRFGNVTTMEPIILQLIPTERFSKVCYICQEQGKGGKSTVGACMQCNKAGCKQQFHVTCAQALGLLCEEAGNYMDNVKYCGYCQHHYSKLKKGGNVKTIPPYKPITSGDNGSSDSSPEKDCEAVARSSSSSAKRKSYMGNKSMPPGMGLKSKSHSPNPSPVDSHNLNSSTESEGGPSISGNSGETMTLKFGTTTSHVPLAGAKTEGDSPSKKFTTSNFIEVVTPSEAVFGTDKSTSPEGSKLGNKKRKSSIGSASGLQGPAAAAAAAIKTEPDPVLPLASVTTSVASSLPHSVANIAATLKNPTVSLPTLNLKPNTLGGASKGGLGVSGLGKTGSTGGGITKPSLTVSGTGTKITISATRDGESAKKAKPENPSSGIVVSVPLTAATITNATDKMAESNTSAVITAGMSSENKSVISEVQPAKRARSSSSDKGRKTKKNSGANSGGAGKRPGRGGPPGSGDLSVTVKELKESPPDSPVDDTKKVFKKKVGAVATVKQEEKDIKPVTSGLSVPHMLGNQLNPNSSMAQKMHDSLSQEMEAHSIYTTDLSSSSNLVGPQLQSKVIALVRSSNAEKINSASLSAANSLLTLGNSSSTSSGGTTQSLDQLLERQWEHGSQFLMEQAQHFDIASLLSCLHQLKAENLKLEEHVNSLLQRRDHLLAVNARLAVPLNTQPSVPATISTTGTNPPPSLNQATMNDAGRLSRPQPMSLENSVPTVNGLASDVSNYVHSHSRSSTQSNQSSPTIRHSGTMYGSQPAAVRTTMSVDQRRPSYQSYPTGPAMVPVVTSQSSLTMRRDDLHQQM